MFQIIATHLMAEVPERECHCYDGVAPLEGHVRKARQIEFTGEMWVMSQEKGKFSGKQDFRATVTDKRITKQGIWIVLKIGEDRVEGNLDDAFGQNRNKKARQTFVWRAFLHFKFINSMLPRRR